MSALREQYVMRDAKRKAVTNMCLSANEQPFESYTTTTKPTEIPSLNEPVLPSTTTTTPSTQTKSKRLKGLVNNEYCSYCDEGGSLINCDRCPASFHLLCHEPPLDDIPKGDFLCNACSYAVSNETSNKTKSSNNNSTFFFERFIESAKSANPRQMELGAELSRLCDLKIPGLNRVKWWIHEKCKVYEKMPTPNSTSPNSVINSSNNLVNDNSSSSGNNSAENSNKGAANSLLDLYKQAKKSTSEHHHSEIGRASCRERV